MLADPRLREFIGGRPDELWRNWVVRRRADAQPVGTVQATLSRRDAGWSAAVAWVVGVPYQGQGYAAEAARALVAWLADRDVGEVVAHIHPDHAASAGVARRAGLRPTGDLVDGEVVWRR